MPLVSKIVKIVAKTSNNKPLSSVKTVRTIIKGRRRRQRGNKNEEKADEDYMTENNEEDNLLYTIDIEDKENPEDQQTDISENTGLILDSEFVSVLEECQDLNINITENTFDTSKSLIYNDLKLKANSSYNALLIEAEKFKAKLLYLFSVSLEKDKNDVDFKLYVSNNSEVNILSYVDNIIKMLKSYDNSNNTCLNYELKFTNESLIQLNQYLNNLRNFENISDSNIRLSTGLGEKNILDIIKKHEKLQLFSEIIRNHTSQLNKTLTPLNIEYIKQNELVLGNKQGVGIDVNHTPNGSSVDDKIVINNNSSSFISIVDKPLEQWKDNGTKPNINLLSNGSFLSNEANTTLTTQSSIIKLPDGMDYPKTYNPSTLNSSLLDNNTDITPSNDIIANKNDNTFSFAIIVAIISIVVIIGGIIGCISCYFYRKKKRRQGNKDLNRRINETIPFIKITP